MFIDCRKRGRKKEGGREGGQGEERQRERDIDMREKHGLVASHTCPNQGVNLQPRYVP